MVLLYIYVKRLYEITGKCLFGFGIILDIFVSIYACVCILSNRPNYFVTALLSLSLVVILTFILCIQTDRQSGKRTDI